MKSRIWLNLWESYENVLYILISRVLIYILIRKKKHFSTNFKIFSSLEKNGKISAIRMTSQIVTSCIFLPLFSASRVFTSFAQNLLLNCSFASLTAVLSYLTVWPRAKYLLRDKVRRFASASTRSRPDNEEKAEVKTWPGSPLSDISFFVQRDVM